LQVSDETVCTIGPPPHLLSRIAHRWTKLSDGGQVPNRLFSGCS